MREALATLARGGPIMIPLAAVSLALWALGLTALLGRRPPGPYRLRLLEALTDVAPFLGLLGTVGGMLLAFRGMARWGAGDPRGLAEGISRALITTEAGLLVALSGLFLLLFVRARLRAERGREDG